MSSKILLEAFQYLQELEDSDWIMRSQADVYCWGHQGSYLGCAYDSGWCWAWRWFGKFVISFKVGVMVNENHNHYSYPRYNWSRCGLWVCDESMTKSRILILVLVVSICGRWYAKRVELERRRYFRVLRSTLIGHTIPLEFKYRKQPWLTLSSDITNIDLFSSAKESSRK